MAKRYETWEVTKMLTENPKLKFQKLIGGKPIPVYYVAKEHNGQGYVFSLDINGGYGCAVFTDTEWILVHEPITFMEAVEAFKKGHTILCEATDCTPRIYKPNDKNMRYFLKCEDGTSISTREILDGKWYIEEE